MSETNNNSKNNIIFAPKYQIFKSHINISKVYRLKDFFLSVIGLDEADLYSEEIMCNQTDIGLTFYTNQMQDTLAAYSYTLVEQGWLILIYNGRQLTLEAGDLYIYSPGFQVTIVGGSEDYRGICLMADEGMTLQMPTIRDIIRTAYLPIAEWGQPVVHIPDTDIHRLSRHMHDVIDYQQSSHSFRAEALRTLYTLFLLDLTDIQERAVGSHKHGERTAELFVSFMRLLPQHFVEHHDIAFYASELCITTTHLSRIVRQITGRTVVDYINQMLAMEASFLLQTTDLPTCRIAERLCFANQSSFSKFFLRMKGINPKRFRMGK